MAQTLASLKQRQAMEGNPWLGVDCKQAGTNDMKVQKVLETLHGKKQQFLLATQVEYTPFIQFRGNSLISGVYSGCEDDSQDRRCYLTIRLRLKPLHVLILFLLWMEETSYRR